MSNKAIVTNLESAKVFSLNHMPIALHESMRVIQKISKLVAFDLVKAILDTQHLDNAEVVKLREDFKETLKNFSNRFRGIGLICTRLGLTDKYEDITSYESFAERFSVLEEFSITYCTESGVMSIVMLIEKNQDFGQYYSVDAVNAANGTILFPIDKILEKIYDKLDDITSELERIAQLANSKPIITIAKK